MRTSLFVAAVALTLIACGEAKAQGKALNSNPNLATLAQQIEAAKISGSCGDSSYLAGINADGSLVCKAFTQQGFTLTVVTQAFTFPGTTPSPYTATVNCPAGERATGGGYDSASTAPKASFPLSDGTGWRAQGAVNTNAGASITLYVVCLK
jgi:hypothetical protein